MRSHFVSFLIVLMSFPMIAGFGACGGAEASLSAGDGGADGIFPPSNRDAELGDASSTLVLVNGLIGGGSQGYDDVRVCIDGVANPLPDAVPMPMTNYPGVGRGTGIDLGPAQLSLTLHVFRASTLQQDAAWASDRVSCSSWLAKVAYTSIPVKLLGGPTLVVLVDDPLGPDGIQARVGALPASYAGTRDSLQLVTAEFSTFAKEGESFRVTLDQGAVGSGETGVLSAKPFAFSTTGGVQDALLRFERVDATEAVTASFEQTLGSVQFLSDPTTATYFDRRTNFAIVLLGDATKPVAQDERDLKFDGKGLHAVAVPYAAAPQ